MSKETETLWVRVGGKFGHFQKPYSNTTKQTYDFFPRSAVAGFLAAGIGLSSDDYYELFDPQITQLGIEITNPVNKLSYALNYKTTTGSNFTTNKLPNGKKITSQKASSMTDSYQRESIEYLRNPEYILYIQTDSDELYSQLKDAIVSNTWVYQPYLGTSECFADIRSGGSSKAELLPKEQHSVSSIIPNPEIDSLIPTENTQIFTSQIVSNFTSSMGGRTPNKYLDIHYNKNPNNQLQVISPSVYQIQLDSKDHTFIPF